jgi:hypothetical protein
MRQRQTQTNAVLRYISPLHAEMRWANVSVRYLFPAVRPAK